MVREHPQLNGREFEQAQGDGEGQGSLACCRARGRKEPATTEWLNRYSDAEDRKAAVESLGFLHVHLQYSSPSVEKIVKYME